MRDWRRPALGDAGVLRPGRWGWARALGWMVVLLAAVAAVLAGPALAGKALALPATGLRTLGLVSLALAYLAYSGLVRWGERRLPDEVAPRPAYRDFGIGAAVGLGMFGLVFAALRLLGAYRVAPGRWDDWAGDVVSNVATGLFEELTLRLVIFRLLARAFGEWPALLLSAALFGALHLSNPNASPVAAVAIAVEAGLMLAAFYLLTGRIWMSVGVHAAWNFAQGPIFGARVSGIAERGSLYVSQPDRHAPAWLSGGAFGPEASVVAMLVGLAVFAAVMRAADAQGALSGGRASASRTANIPA